MKTYILIEQAEDNEAYITHIKAKNEETALEDYQSIGRGNLIVLNEQAYYNLCQSGVGA